MPSAGDLISLLLRPLSLLFALFTRLIGSSNEPRLRIAVDHVEWQPGEVDVTGLIVENIGYPRASATKRAHAVRVRCRIDAEGPFDLYWEGIPASLTADLLEDEAKGLEVAYRWLGPGYKEVNGVALPDGITYFADGSLEQHHILGMALDSGQHALEVTCHNDDTGRARARFTLIVPAHDDNSLLVLNEKT